MFWVSLFFLLLDVAIFAKKSKRIFLKFSRFFEEFCDITVSVFLGIFKVSLMVFWDFRFWPRGDLRKKCAPM